MARRTMHIVSLIKSPPSLSPKPVNEKKPGYTTELSHPTPKSPQLKSNYFLRFFNIHFSSHENVKPAARASKLSKEKRSNPLGNELTNLRPYWSSTCVRHHAGNSVRGSKQLVYRSQTNSTSFLYSQRRRMDHRIGCVSLPQDQ